MKKTAKTKTKSTVKKAGSVKKKASAKKAAGKMVAAKKVPAKTAAGKMVAAKKAPAKTAPDIAEIQPIDDEMLVTRKLIRPDLSNYKHPKPRRPAQKKKSPPPENTNMETFFIARKKEKQNPVVIKLTGGRTVRGWIEYYDKDLIKIRSEKPPHLLIRKDSIIYMYDDSASGETRKKRK